MALWGLRMLVEQAQTQARAVMHAQKASSLASARYKAGLVIVLEVIDAERTLLQAQRANVQILNQQMATSVALIKALGGGWQERATAADSRQAATASSRS
jgi:multidrug efflux system outer membrane protein